MPGKVYDAGTTGMAEGFYFAYDRALLPAFRRAFPVMDEPVCRTIVVSPLMEILLKQVEQLAPASHLPGVTDRLDLCAMQLIAEAFAGTAGAWFDYWTGESLHGPADIPAKSPEGRGGVLFARAGAIIPRAPAMEYFGHKSRETLELEIFPGNRAGPFVLYEDDGETEAWRNGAIATTNIHQALSPASAGLSENDMQAGAGRGSESPRKEVLTLTVAPRQGHDGMSERRCWQLLVHCAKPESVMVNGQPMTGWKYDAGKGILSAPGLGASAEKDFVVKVEW